MRDDVAVVGELADQGVDLTERERRRRVPLKIAPDEAVVATSHSRAAAQASSTAAGPCFFTKPRTPRRRRTPASPSWRWIAVHSVPIWVPARAAWASSVSVVGGVRAG